MADLDVRVAVAQCGDRASEERGVEAGPTDRSAAQGAGLTGRVEIVVPASAEEDSPRAWQTLATALITAISPETMGFAAPWLHARTTTVADMRSTTKAQKGNPACALRCRDLRVLLREGFSAAAGSCLVYSTRPLMWRRGSGSPGPRFAM